MDKLPILFRAERSGPHKGYVTAVFPTLPGTNAYDFTCYAHLGQHGSARLEWYGTTRPATPAEYADLLRELRGIYETGDDACKLVIRQRFPANATALRRAACA